MFIYLTKNKNHVHCRWGGPEERLVSHKDLSRPRPKLTSTGRRPLGHFYVSELLYLAEKCSERLKQLAGSSFKGIEEKVKVVAFSEPKRF